MEINYTELLEKEYGQDQMASRMIQHWRSQGRSDEEFYKTLESFY